MKNTIYCSKYRHKGSIAGLFWAYLSLLLCLPALGAQVTVALEDGVQIAKFAGRIESGDAKAITEPLSSIDTSLPVLLEIESRGGIVAEIKPISQVFLRLRKVLLESGGAIFFYVEKRCESACVPLFLSLGPSIYAHPEASFAFHSPTTIAGPFKELSTILGRSRYIETLGEYGVHPDWLKRHNSIFHKSEATTFSAQVLVLDGFAALTEQNLTDREALKAKIRLAQNSRATKFPQQELKSRLQSLLSDLIPNFAQDNPGAVRLPW